MEILSQCDDEKPCPHSILDGRIRPIQRTIPDEDRAIELKTRLIGKNFLFQIEIFLEDVSGE